jgi:hypothetical protein
MTEKRQSMGPVLKQMGSEQFQVQTDRQDFAVQMFQTPDGKNATVPAPALITFMAMSCREVGEGTDLWEFRVAEQQGGVQVAALLYWRGIDILSVKAISKVA